MAELDKILCPSCGSTALMQADDDSLTCQHCQSRFIPKRGKMVKGWWQEDENFKTVTATGECPICGKIVAAGNSFRCKKCNRPFICLQHQDPDSFFCLECEKETRFDVFIKDIGPRKTEVIKLIRVLTNVTETKALVNGFIIKLPASHTKVLERTDKEATKDVSAKLEAAGAVVELKYSGTEVTHSQMARSQQQPVKAEKEVLPASVQSPRKGKGYWQTINLPLRLMIGAFVALLVYGAMINFEGGESVTVPLGLLFLAGAGWLVVNSIRYFFGWLSSRS